VRSLIILEVEHGDTTDGLQYLLDTAIQAVGDDLPHAGAVAGQKLSLNNYTVRVDLPECFVLDS
jgi:hypothetical protein